MIELSDIEDYSFICVSMDRLRNMSQELQKLKMFFFFNFTNL